MPLDKKIRIFIIIKEPVTRVSKKQSGKLRKKPMVTIKDISRRLGISHATVSYVLNGRAESFKIRKEVTEKILATARELGYVRNTLARSMVTGRSNTIAFIINSKEMNAEYIQRILTGMLQAVEKYEFSLKLFDWQLSGRDTIIRYLQEQRIMGVIFHHPDINILRPWLADLEALQISCCIANLRNDTGIGCGVSTDDAECVEQAVRHLISLGHSRIAHLTADMDWKYVREREKGYLNGMKQLPGSRPRILRIGLNGFGSNLEALKHFLLEPPEERASAVVCDSDYHAMELFQAAYQLNIRIPDSLSVVGFGGLSPSRCTPVLFSTIEQPFEEIGCKSAAMLLDHIVNHAPIDGRNIVLSNRFRQAASTAPPPLTAGTGITTIKTKE